MASERASNPFSELIEDIVESVAHFEFIQSYENDVDFDAQFERAYDQFKDHEDNVYKKITALLEANNTNEKEEELKDSQKALAYREAGNKYFKNEKFAEALTCYNKSIFFAACPESLDEETGEYTDLALGLVNRN